MTTPPEIAQINLPYIFDTTKEEPEVGDLVGGRFRIVSLIGEGSFGRVYHGECEGKDVALKVLRDNVLAGLTEVRTHALAQRHELAGEHHIMRLIEAFHHFECDFVLVTELLGPSLRAHYTHLEDRGERARFYHNEKLRTLGQQMLDALDFLSGLGIAHCDVKPDNICIADAEGNEFRLIDLGAATFDYAEHWSYVQSRHYRAPEVMLGCNWGPPIDIWGLGCTMAELAIGLAIFKYSSVELVLAAQQALCGPIPVWMRQSDPIASAFLTSSGIAYEIDPTGEPEGCYLVYGNDGVTLHSVLSVIDPADFGDVEGFTDFASSLLTIDPRMRPSARELLDGEYIGAVA